MGVNRVFDLLDYSIEKYDLDVLVAAKKAGKWESYSSRKFKEYAEYVSSGLIESQVKKGDCIGIISGNRPEWNIADFGASQIGAITIPIHPTLSSTDLVYIFNQTKTKIAFVSNKFTYIKLKEVKDQIPSLKKIISFQKLESTILFSDFIEMGKNKLDRGHLESLKSNVDTEDTYTILYTSGTTGIPKGVVLTHQNFAEYLPIAAPTLMKGTEAGDKSISFLPLSHIFERSVFLKYMYMGISVHYAEDFQTLVQNIQEVKPHIMTSVPLLLEKVYENIVKFGESLEGEIKQKFNWAMNLALKYDPNAEYTEEEKKNLQLADQFVYSKWREFLGGNYKKIICGGAAVPLHLQRIFWAANMPVMEGYGITEVTGLFSIVNFGQVKFNTVGKPIPALEVKIAEDGEILCKGKTIFKEYYKNEEATAEAIDENGWFHTGDIGVIDHEGYLQITGRKKVIFKTKAGVYVSPERVENELKQFPLIKHAMVLGANQETLSSLIVPDFEYLRKYCEEKGFEFSIPEEMVEKEFVLNLVQKGVDLYNQQAAMTHHIKDFELLHNEWTIEGGELTSLAKLRRNNICEKYKEAIENLGL